MPISTGLGSDSLRVGIVLAQDRQVSVSLSWSAGDIEESSVPIADDVTAIEVVVEGDRLRLDLGAESAWVPELTLKSTDDVQALQKGQGIAVEPVPTGRGFHWQDEIRVTLPGSLAIRVREGVLQVVNTLGVECYVACVATSEMGAAAPAALLAAQTIVARCWALALVEMKHRDEGFHVCNDDCCQRYQGSTFVSQHSIEAALDTVGEVLTYDDHVIDARYSKNCGGLVEDFRTAWDGDAVPYLVPLWDASRPPGPPHFGQFAEYYRFQDAFCSTQRLCGVDLQSMLGNVDVEGHYYRWEQALPVAVLLANVREYSGLDWRLLDGIEVHERGASARIRLITLRGRDERGKEIEKVVRGEYLIRQLFSESFLYSSAFEILNEESFQDDGFLSLRGCGWGHGVGLCQMGALSMALEGHSASSILGHYYPGTLLTTLD